MALEVRSKPRTSRRRAWAGSASRAGMRPDRDGVVLDGMNPEQPGSAAAPAPHDAAGPPGRGTGTGGGASEALWTAVVLAGQRPGIDPVAARFGGRFKALVPLQGEPMLSHVLRALLGTTGIGSVVVLSQQDFLTGPLAWSAVNGRVVWMSSGAGIAQSLIAALGSLPSPWPVLVTTADHPLLTPNILESFMSRASGDLAIGLVEQAVMLAAFPNTRRTWLRFRDGAYTGANLFALRRPASLAALRFWAEAERDRKKPWRLFRRFGPVLALRAITRTIGLRAAIAAAGRRLCISAAMVELDRAEAGIDVDSPADHALAERLLALRSPIGSAAGARSGD